MRPHRSVQITSLLLSAALAAAISQTPACSNGDTVLALTINSNQADVGGPANLKVTVKSRTSAKEHSEMFAPDLVDGAIIASFFRRITLNGFSGEVDITVEARNASDSTYLSATTAADLVENGAVAARVELKVAVPPPPDGGAGGTGGGSTGGSGGGSAGGPAGGSAGGSGGSDSAASGGTGSGGSGSGGAGGSNLAGNLIANGDFAAGMANWHVENDTGTVTNGRLCIMAPGSTMLLGWTAPTKVTVDGAKMYRISYSASATSGSVKMHVKVAHSVDPYTSIYEVDETLNNNMRTFTHTFTPMNGTDNDMGIAITTPNGTTATVCVDDVSMVPVP